MPRRRRDREPTDLDILAAEIRDICEAEAWPDKIMSLYKSTPAPEHYRNTLVAGFLLFAANGSNDPVGNDAAFELTEAVFGILRSEVERRVRALLHDVRRLREQGDDAAADIRMTAAYIFATWLTDERGLLSRRVYPDDASVIARMREIDRYADILKDPNAPAEILLAACASVFEIHEAFHRGPALKNSELWRAFYVAETRWGALDAYAELEAGERSSVLA